MYLTFFITVLAAVLSVFMVELEHDSSDAGVAAPERTFVDI